jgi:peptidoglycan/xylan/chitin deacetylase (PgdA/CDA1 family)
MFRIILLILLTITLLSACHASDNNKQLEQHAVILVYHRFGEDRYPSTSVTLKQFEQQIQILSSGQYHVWPVTKIIRYLQQGKNLPNKTLGITIDDAYESTYTQAWPRLKAAHLPFTLMVSTDAVDKHYRDFMTWQQIKSLQQQGVTIGLHTASHIHFIDHDNQKILADLKKSQQRLKTELGKKATLFAYPYGEYQSQDKYLLQAVGITAAFKQTSGVITKHSNFYALPRFAINKNYGNKKRFKLISQALPFEIKNLKPALLITDNNPPIISFDVINKDLLTNSLSCYQSELGKLPIVVDKNRVVITPTQPFTLRRTHINCTVADKSHRWHWLGLMFILQEISEA